MGLVLFPGDGDTSSPDVSWSYTGFAAFRRRLAETEGFILSEMWGFGGERPWSKGVHRSGATPRSSRRRR